MSIGNFATAWAFLGRAEVHQSARDAPYHAFTIIFAIFRLPWYICVKRSSFPIRHLSAKHGCDARNLSSFLSMCLVFQPSVSYPCAAWFLRCLAPQAHVFLRWLSPTLSPWHGELLAYFWAPWLGPTSECSPSDMFFQQGRAMRVC